MKSFRNLLFWLHLTAGCVARLAILTICVTGVLLAFERQVNACAVPKAVRPQGNTSSIPSLDAVTEAHASRDNGCPINL